CAPRAKRQRAVSHVVAGGTSRRSIHSTVTTVLRGSLRALASAAATIWSCAAVTIASHCRVQSSSAVAPTLTQYQFFGSRLGSRLKYWVYSTTWWASAK